MWGTGVCDVMLLQSQGLKLSKALIYLPIPSVMVFSLNSLSFLFLKFNFKIKDTKNPNEVQLIHGLHS